MEQLILHLLGDYVLQSDWMALEKRRSSVAAFTHAAVYATPFLFLTGVTAPGSGPAWVTIVGTHFFIDRFGLARYVVWAKNWLSPRATNPPFSICATTGYPPDRPVWLTTWLLIAADNTLHLICNYAALRWVEIGVQASKA